MQLLDDNLFMNFVAGKISAEEAIDKSRNPGQMVDRLKGAGADVEFKEDGVGNNGDDTSAGGASGAKLPPKPGQPGGSSAAGGGGGADEAAAKAAAKSRPHAGDEREEVR